MNSCQWHAFIMTAAYLALEHACPKDSFNSIWDQVLIFLLKGIKYTDKYQKPNSTQLQMYVLLS